MKRRLLVSLPLLVFGAVPGAEAQSSPPGMISGTTCDGAVSAVEELSFGAYHLPGPDRSYHYAFTYPMASCVTLRESPVSQTLAVCDGVPGPRAHCRATTVAAGQAASLLISTITSEPTSAWIVVDSNPGCGSYQLHFSGPLGG
jgi:hypothetical protein